MALKSLPVKPLLLSALLLPAAIATGLTLMNPTQQATASLPTAVAGQPLPTLAPMLKQAAPAVVNIAIQNRNRRAHSQLLDDPVLRHFFGMQKTPRQPPRRAQSTGSGVIVDANKGYLITNHHVIDDADEIIVTLHDGRNVEAKLVGTDQDSDIAVLQIKADNLTALPIADSEQLQVGDFVVAIGSPFGLTQTVTSGIVSALGRNNLGIEGYEDFIQTDASINMGHSGGPLVNLRGELVGINTAILAPGGGNIGIGFAIPANMAKTVMQQLIDHGEVKRGQIGVQLQDLTSDIAQAMELQANIRGALIASVIKGSPAETAGFKTGDVVVRVGDKVIDNAADLRNAIGLQRIGDTLKVEVLRKGEKLSLTPKVGSVQAFADLDSAAASAEAWSERLEGAQFQEQATDEGSTQVEVTRVERGSRAWHTGLRPGDVIVSANRADIHSLKDLRLALQQGGKSLLLNIQRGDAALFIAIR